MAPAAVAGFSGSLTNSTIGIFAGALVAALPGNCAITVGAAASAAVVVVKAPTKSVSGLPDRSRTPFVRITDTTLDAGKLDVSMIVRLSVECAMSGVTRLPFTNIATLP